MDNQRNTGSPKPAFAFVRSRDLRAKRLRELAKNFRSMHPSFFKYAPAKNTHSSAAKILCAIAALPLGQLKFTWLTGVKRTAMLCFQRFKVFNDLFLQRPKPGAGACFSIMHISLCHGESLATAAAPWQLIICRNLKTLSIMSSAQPDLIAAARTQIQRGLEFNGLDLLRQAIKGQLPLGEHWAEVMQLCEQLGDEDGAAEAARLYGASAPNDPKRALIYVEKLSRVGETELALNLSGQLLSQNPDDAAIHYINGTLASRLGRFDAAETSLRKALAIKPDLADAWVQIGAFRNLAEHPGDIDTIRNLTEHGGGLVEIAALFALGKAYDDAKDYAGAFKSWDLANSELSAVRPFDPRSIQRLQTACSENPFELPNPSPRAENGGPTPLFIVGAPRTGTTLTEHILASHPMVSPLGESLISRVATWPVRHLRPADFDAAQRALGPGVWQMMGAAYRALAKKRAGSASFVTDKAAMLHLFVGVLAKSLPNARFIWIRRTPEAAAVSAYRTYFTSGNAWSNNIQTALSYLTAHNRLMEEWAGQLGPRLLSINFEDLVANPQETIPKLTSFAALATNNGPLNFHESTRAVDTASLAQVRQPMRPDRAEAWRVYESFISERANIEKAL